jgi:hypothetical protein
MLLFWRNHDDMAMLDWRTRHGACELEPDGSPGVAPETVREPKLIAQRWLNWRRQRRRSLDDVQELVEEDTLTDMLRTCVDLNSARASGIDTNPRGVGFHVEPAERYWGFNQPLAAELEAWGQ